MCWQERGEGIGRCRFRERVDQGGRLRVSSRWCGRWCEWVRVWEMKLLTWNVRGLGAYEKRKEVCAMMKEKRPLIFCIQETKLQLCDDGVCLSV